MGVSFPNVLVIGDTHLPFEHVRYLDFCYRIHRDFDCEIVVHIGDLVDNHAISFHDHDPDGDSSKREILEAKKRLLAWTLVFPKVWLCAGNHDTLPSRRLKSAGISENYLKSFEAMWELPPNWKLVDHFSLGKIRFFHGEGYGGDYPHANACRREMQSVVIGHYHSVAGVHWVANETKKAFGLCVGCGIDRHKYAFAYGKFMRRKPILGCGVITDSGEDARFIPMRLGRRR